MRRAFSLIELLVVIAIMALLVGVAAPYYSDYIKESKKSKARTDLDVLKQAVILYNSREDIPYQGQLGTGSTYVPILGENDFVGLQGQYLANIPLDPWGKNYRLDPYGGFVFSDGPDSTKKSDDLREYYVKDLAIRKIEWEDTNNNRNMDTDDLLYFHFNKSVWVPGGILSSHFDVYENNVATTAVSFGVAADPTLNVGYLETSATTTTLLYRVSAGNTVKLGVHAVALKDDVGTRELYQEVIADRTLSNTTQVVTRVEYNAATGKALRFIARTNPIKIMPK